MRPNKMKLSNKVISALCLSSKCSFTPSKLRFLRLRKVAIKGRAKQMLVLPNQSNQKPSKKV